MLPTLSPEALDAPLGKEALIIGGKKRRGNKSLTAWVKFVKKVAKEEKLTYRDAMMRAKVRKDKGEKWMSGGNEIDGTDNGTVNGTVNGDADGATNGATNGADGELSITEGGRRRRSRRNKSKRRGSKRSSRRGTKKRR